MDGWTDERANRQFNRLMDIKRWMEGHMARWTDERRVGQRDRWIYRDEWTDRWISRDGWVDGVTDEWPDGWMDRWTGRWI